MENAEVVDRLTNNAKMDKFILLCEYVGGCHLELDVGYIAISCFLFVSYLEDLLPSSASVELQHG